MRKSKKHKEYQKARNKLIVHAARYADKICGEEAGDNWDIAVEAGDNWDRDWNRAFLDRMNVLVKEQRL